MRDNGRYLNMAQNPIRQKMAQRLVKMTDKEKKKDKFLSIAGLFLSCFLFLHNLPIETIKRIYL